MAKSVLYDADNQLLDSEAEDSRITWAGGCILSVSDSQSDYTRDDYSLMHHQMNPYGCGQLNNMRMLNYLFEEMGIPSSVMEFELAPLQIRS